MNAPHVAEKPSALPAVACGDLFSQGESYSPMAMVERAVRNARPHRTYEAPRWVAVMDVFGYGSTTSTELCRLFGLDPHEKVAGIKCDCEDIG